MHQLYQGFLLVYNQKKTTKIHYTLEHQQGSTLEAMVKLNTALPNNEYLYKVLINSTSALGNTGYTKHFKMSYFLEQGRLQIFQSGAVQLLMEKMRITSKGEVVHKIVTLIIVLLQDRTSFLQ